MENIFSYRQMLLLVILGGFLLLFLPFTLDFFFASGLIGNVYDASHDSTSFSVNYFQDCFNFINNFKYPFRFPFIEVLGIFMVLILPCSILLEFVFFYRRRYKTVLILCIISLMSLLEFSYSHFEYLQYGCGLLILQQLFLLLNLTLNKKLR
ncbi:hypothetical protein [Flavobacterium poyangense]|uniref:hypothetical protein n=1 Tax=Flavobacterium poyangense TaxID=2204302 RepID=UPI001AB03276|nr:hypothetical protein [Flavobacterium sp. JXAS1]